MSVKTQIPESAGIYFVTFTCCLWLPLFEITNAYDTVYNWFDHLKKEGHYILGYITMPNHLHAIICCSKNEKGVNKLVSNGKRFMAYEIVKRLKHAANDQVLDALSAAVTDSDKRRGKLHQVFEPSFDCKECRTEKFLRQKLDYLHLNPARGKWNLSKTPIDYVHSSAKFYYTGEQGIYEVLNYLELRDMEWAKPRSDKEI